MRTLIAVAVTVLCAESAFARLGETPQECAKRYGAPLQEQAQGNVTIQFFKKSGIAVRVYFMLKKEKLFAFPRAAGIVYAKPAGSTGENQPLSKTDLMTFLDANSQGKEWNEIDLIRTAAEERSGPGQDRLIRDAHEFRHWRTEGGVQAHYIKKTHELVIRSTDEIPLPKQEEKEEEKEPEHLDGF